jgi:hypothetical protein
MSVSKGHLGGPWLLCPQVSVRVLLRKTGETRHLGRTADALCCVPASTRDRRASALQRSTALATPNYSYEKRQRELAKKRKNEEKLQKKKQGPGEGTEQDNEPTSGAPAEPGSTPPSVG